MSKILTNPFQSVALNCERIANVVVEDNQPQGRSWMKLWVVPGVASDPSDEGTFVQSTYPIRNDVLGYIPGGEAREIQFENGIHPLRPTMALGQCDTCGKWYQATSGDCTVPECNGTIDPYQPVSQLAQAWFAFRDAVYAKLMAEEIPNPDNFDETVKLMDATDPE